MNLNYIYFSVYNSTIGCNTEELISFNGHLQNYCFSYTDSKNLSETSFIYKLQQYDVYQVLDCVGTPYLAESLTTACSEQSPFASEGTSVETTFINLPVPNDIGLWQLAVFYGEVDCQGSFLSFEANINTFANEATGCINFNSGPFKSAYFNLTVNVPDFPVIPNNEPFTVYRFV